MSGPYGSISPRLDSGTRMTHENRPYRRLPFSFLSSEQSRTSHFQPVHSLEQVDYTSRCERKEARLGVGVLDFSSGQGRYSGCQLENQAIYGSMTLIPVVSKPQIAFPLPFAIVFRSRLRFDEQEIRTPNRRIERPRNGFYVFLLVFVQDSR